MSDTDDLAARVDAILTALALAFPDDNFTADVRTLINQQAAELERLKTALEDTEVRNMVLVANAAHANITEEDDVYRVLLASGPIRRGLSTEIVANRQAKAIMRLLTERKES